MVWLAQQAGSTGRVVATNIDLRYLDRLKLPNLEVVRHNILEDSSDVLAPLRARVNESVVMRPFTRACFFA